MKKLSYAIVILGISFLTACTSDDDDPRSNYPKKVDIEFIINATNEDILSQIETVISTGTNEDGDTNLDIRTFSESNNHLPFNKTYKQQNIEFMTRLGLSYKDNSILSIGDTFETYSVELTIKVKEKIVANEVFLIEEDDQIVNLGYSFLD